MFSQYDDTKIGPLDQDSDDDDGIGFLEPNSEMVLKCVDEFDKAMADQVSLKSCLETLLTTFRSLMISLSLRNSTKTKRWIASREQLQKTTILKATMIHT